MQAYGDPHSLAAVRTFFSWHGRDDLVVPYRVDLFALLHILDNRNNYTCKFGEEQRCFALLENTNELFDAFLDFCFHAEDPLISEGDDNLNDHASWADIDSLPYRLETLFEITQCAEHQYSAKLSESRRSASFYMLAVTAWRRQYFRSAWNVSPLRPEKKRLSKILTAPHVRLPSMQYSTRRMSSIDEDREAVPVAKRVEGRKFTLNEQPSDAGGAAQNLKISRSGEQAGNSPENTPSEEDDEREGSLPEQQGSDLGSLKSSDDLPMVRPRTSRRKTKPSLIDKMRKKFLQ